MNRRVIYSNIEKLVLPPGCRPYGPEAGPPARRPYVSESQVRNNPPAENNQMPWVLENLNVGYEKWMRA